MHIIVIFIPVSQNPKHHSHLHLYHFLGKFSSCISKSQFIWHFHIFHNIHKHLKIQKVLISYIPTSRLSSFSLFYKLHPCFTNCTFQVQSWQVQSALSNQDFIIGSRTLSCTSIVFIASLNPGKNPKHSNHSPSTYQLLTFRSPST